MQKSWNFIPLYPTKEAYENRAFKQRSYNLKQVYQLIQESHTSYPGEVNLHDGRTLTFGGVRELLEHMGKIAWNDELVYNVWLYHTGYFIQ